MHQNRKVSFCNRVQRRKTMIYELVIDRGEGVWEIIWEIKEGKALLLSTWWFNRAKQRRGEIKTKRGKTFPKILSSFPLLSISLHFGGKWKGMHIAEKYPVLPQGGKLDEKNYRVDLGSTLREFEKVGIKLPKNLNLNINCWGAFCCSSSEKIEGENGTILCKDGLRRCPSCAEKIL